jgi:hypothetical protein
MEPSPSEPPGPRSEPPPRAPIKGGVGLVILGFAVGAAVWLWPFAQPLNLEGGGLTAMAVACFILPLVSLIFAIIRRTRRLGQGLLLACGLGWLILGAICGGLFR